LAKRSAGSSRQNFKRWGAMAPHTLRELERHTMRIALLSAEAREHLDSDPERTQRILVRLCLAYRAVATLGVVSMAGSLFAGASCAARLNRKRVSLGLTRLGDKYLKRGFAQGVPDSERAFLSALDALAVLPRGLALLVKDMKPAWASDARRRVRA
jgi:hypothetical protein